MSFNTKFKLIGFTRTPFLAANLMVLSTGHVMKISLKELVCSEISDDLNKNENREIYRKLYGSEGVKTAYEFSDRHEKSWNAYFLITLALCVIYIFSTICGVKPFYIPFTNIVTTPGIFIYPLTFLLIDILNEFYGLRLARRAIIVSFMANLFLVSGLWIVSLTHGLPEWKLASTYNEMVSNIVSVLVASSVAYLVSENINVYLLCKIKHLTKSRYLFIRVITSTVIASAFDTIIFIFIAFYGVLGMEIIKEMILSQFLIKLGYAFFGVAPIYLSRIMFNNFINAPVKIKNTGAECQSV